MVVEKVESENELVVVGLDVGPVVELDVGLVVGLDVGPVVGPVVELVVGLVVVLAKYDLFVPVDEIVGTSSVVQD